MSLSSLDVDAQIAKLADPSTDINIKLGIIKEFSQILTPEAQRDPDSHRITNAVFPVLIDTLKAGSPVWKKLINDKENVEQALRMQSLEFLQRFTSTEHIRPHLSILAPLLLEMIRKDNEDIGVLALKMFSDITRLARQFMENYVTEFIQLALDLYGRSQDTVDDLFGPKGPAVVEPDRTMFSSASQSLKILTDLPLCLGFILQSLSASPAQTSAIQQVTEAAVKFFSIETPQEKDADATKMDEDGIIYDPPAAIAHKKVFYDLIAAQEKTGSLLGNLIKKDSPIVSSEAWTRLCSDIPRSVIRILRLMPLEAYTPRKETLHMLRQLFLTDMRNSFAEHIPLLLDERTLLGNLRSEHALCNTAYTVLASLVLETRGIVTLPIAFTVLRRSAELISDPTISHILHSIGVKMIVGMLDAVTKNKPTDPENLVRLNVLLHAVLETFSTRLQASVTIGQRLMTLREGSPSEDLKQLIALEQSRTVPILYYITVSDYDTALMEEKTFIRSVLTAVKNTLQAIRSLNARVPDADVMGRIFESVCLSLPLHKGDPQAELMTVQLTKDILVEMEPHVFQEVWSTKMDTFFNAVSISSGGLSILTGLFQQPATMYSLTAILLRYLIDNLETLLEKPPQTVAVVIRMLRMTFSSVASFPDGNERILFPHLTRLLVDIFPMAARSQDPRNFLSVPYYLFRSLGQKTQVSRFEMLHKEVYLLLPELLDGVNRALESADDPVQREQLVEIALTTPARLQHLAPFITQLWRPLVFALRSQSGDLLRQGLRTLELAVENLPSVDLLDPNAEPVARELVLALHKVLRPGPVYADTAQAASRILGKIGGQNRRILGLAPDLQWEPSTFPAAIPVEFSSHIAQLPIKPACEVAITILGDAKATMYHEEAFEFLRTQTLYLLQTGINDRSSEDLFEIILEGLISTIHLPNMETLANDFLRSVGKSLFEMEMSLEITMQARRPPVQPVTNLYLESISAVLVQRTSGNQGGARRLLANIIQDLHDQGQNLNKERRRNVYFLFAQLMQKFVSLCSSASWRRKMAACTAIQIMISEEINLGTLWPYTKEIDLARGLMVILKDMPIDPPAEVPEVTNTLLKLIRFCNENRSQDHMQIDSEASEMIPEEVQARDWVTKPLSTKAEMYLTVFIHDLGSPTAAVREATQASLELIAELAGLKYSDFIRPSVDKLTSHIFSKPLRIYQAPIQIGYMEAMRYLLKMEPPVLEASEELWRLLNEVIALGEADDVPVNPMQKITRRATQLNGKTKAASIRLITASLVVADYFSKQPQIRQRATSLLFKALYSVNSEIKSAAHEGLKVFLRNQSRIPREHLQAGLRPVLMNLADPSKLTVASLEGLARLLSLLTNYFKVEIATKLIDHFKALSSDESMREVAFGPMADNDTIAKLVKLLNIFHLLPPAANTYLEQVMVMVVSTETKIHAASPTPFTPPLSAYLDRFPSDGLNILFNHIKENRFVQTFRHVIQGRAAPTFMSELKTRGTQLARSMENAGSGHAGLPPILLCLDLTQVDPKWMTTQEDILETLKAIWTSLFSDEVDESGFNSGRLVLIRAIYTTWMEVLRLTPRVDLLYSLALIFTRPLQLDVSDLLDFIFLHVAVKTSVAFKHEAVQLFINTLEDGSFTEPHVLQYLRIIVIPLLTAEFRQANSPDEVVSDGLITKIWEKIWTQVTKADWAPALKMELLQMSGILAANAVTRIGAEIRRKDLAKYIWPHFTAEEATLRNTAFLAAARFFSHKDVPSDRFLAILWAGLLKPPADRESSPIIRQALDVLTPVMSRLVTNEGTPNWAYVAYRTLTEDVNTTVHICSLVLRHSDLFYPFRELFFPQFVQSLPRLGFSVGQPKETRDMFLDLIDLITEWQKRASQEQKDAMVVDSETTNNRGVLMTHSKDTIVTCLVRYALGSPDSHNKPGLTARHFVQLKALIASEEWSEVTIRLNFLSRAFDAPDSTEAAAVVSLLSNIKVLNAISGEKPQSWFLANANMLFTFSKRAMTSSSDFIVDAFAPIFDRLLEALTLGDEGMELTGAAADVYQWMSDTVRDAFTNGTRIAATLAMLMSLAKTSPSRIEPFSGGLMKIYGKLIKDHLSPQHTQPLEHMPVTIQRVLTILEISRISVGFFGDQRKSLLSGLVSLVSTSPSHEIRRRILNISREWVLERPSTIPTAKEKASLLLKMQSWQKHGDQIYKDYLGLVYDIYTTPTLARTDLTVRLEAAFILGCRAEDKTLRNRFLDHFSNHLPKTLGARLAYLFGGQNWESVIEYNWSYIVVDMVFGAANMEGMISPSTYALQTLPVSQIHLKDFLRPMRHLLFYSPQATHDTFVPMFPEVWRGLTRKEQADITASIIHVLTKDARQEFPQPNIYQSLFGGIHKCNPPMHIPPHVLKYYAKQQHAWYVGMEMLQHSVEQTRDDDNSIRDATQDALAELYAELCEDDYYYGLWRRRCLYEETNAALSYEQNGFYHYAQPLYEVAQIKARQNIYPMSEAEYYVWEDHWMLCTEKLLQWDILSDVASGEANADLALECAWRTLQTWNSENVIVATYMNHVQDPITPRRQLFKAYYTLNSMATAAREQQQPVAQAAAQGLQQPTPVKLDIDASSEFSKLVDEANQLAIRKWVALPDNVTMAHVPLLAQFQQVVELREASVLMTTLLATTRENLNEKAHEAKSIFLHWRERLPQFWDDIGIWNDLVSWRQHIFHAVNKFYLPLLPDPPTQSTASTHAHRGHHESAWIINRFAHVARKHGLLQVCQNALADIYKLPNIEISEAFLKLREQARCHYEKGNELYPGLDVINNTNLMYFTGPQKAEFFAMKGLFLHKMGRPEEANAAFGQAVHLDLSMPKAWALWGLYSDDMHTHNPNDYSFAANAVSCYLQAAALYKSAKCRPLLNRVLWLLSMDDQQQTAGRMWESHKGEHVYWYWITLIPQLLMSLFQREGRYAHQVLYNIAKNYPQALYFHLRSLRDEFAAAKREYTQRMQAANQHDASQAASASSAATQGLQASGADQSTQGGEQAGQQADGTKQPFDLQDELIALLKTAHPLLALTMESMAEQIRERLKPSTEEETYRWTGTMLIEALQSRMSPAREAHTVPAQFLVHAQKLWTMLPIGPLKDEFEATMVKRAPTWPEYLGMVIKVRDAYEVLLDKKPRIQALDMWSYYLVEFHYSKTEKISVPGQYQEHKDSNSHFVDIKRISTKLERCRGPLFAFRRLTFIGNDGSNHTFTTHVVQHSRIIRRDERLMQIIRIFNETLRQKKEARKRNLEFHILPSVSLTYNLRLVRLDSSYVSLMDIHDDYCKERGFGREEPILAFQEKLRTYYDAKQESSKDKDAEIRRSEYYQLRLDTKNEIEAKYIPRTIISNYMKRTMKDCTSLWLMRKQFTLQTATTSFLIYSMCINSRTPQKHLLSRSTGLIGLAELSLTLRPDQPSLLHQDQTPFRLTPNIQDFITPGGIEGLLTSGMLALSRGLLEPECEVEKQMWLFVRDDILLWYKIQGKNFSNDRLEFRISVADTIEKILKRMSQMSGSVERTKAQAAEGTSSSLPTTTVVAGIQQMINAATNPGLQAKNHDITHPWF